MLLDALLCKNYSRPPVWLMRQAGRYMPQYQKIKAGKELLTVFKDKDLIVEVTKLPIDLLDVDAAILFSDILIILEAFNIEYAFLDKIGPKIFTDITLDHFISFDLNRLKFVFDAIEVLKKDLKVPLIGFAGAPFTVASYLIEKGSSKDYKKVKSWIYNDPKGFYKLLDLLSVAIAAFLDVQVEKGAQALQLFDSWANILSYDDYQTYSVGFLRKILSLRKHKHIPLIFFSRGSGQYVEEIISTGVSCISVDWTHDLSKIRGQLPSQVSLQGNLDPQAFYGSKESLRKEVEKILNKMKGHPGFIFNLGHGIPPDAPFENVKYVVELVKCSA